MLSHAPISVICCALQQDRNLQISLLWSRLMIRFQYTIQT